MKERDLPWKFHPCKLCSYRSKSVHLILRHIRKIHWRPPTSFDCHNDLTLFKCPKCEFETHIKVNLKNHIDITHDQLNPNHNLADLHRGHTCKTCNFHTFTVLTLVKHVCIKGLENIKWFECDECPFKSKWNTELRIHITICPTRDAKVLDNIEWFECEQCPHKTKRKEYLKRHITRVHATKRFTCEHCPYETSDRRALKIHTLRKHTDPSKIKWFHCEQCSYKSKVKQDLIQHVNHFHPTKMDGINWFTCEHCSYKTNLTWRIKQHMLRKHIDLAKIEWFQCDQCSYKAKVKHDLKRHVDIMHCNKPDGAKVFKCEQCSYKANGNRWNLKQHMLRKHTDLSKVELIQCGQCSYKSKVQQDVNKHVKKVHPPLNQNSSAKVTSRSLIFDAVWIESPREAL